MIQFVARGIDWAKHHPRKPATKCLVCLNPDSLSRHFGMVDRARDHDSVIVGKGYADFSHLANLAMCEVFSVARAKENLESPLVPKFQRGRAGDILADDLIELISPARRKANRMRRVIAVPFLDSGHESRARVLDAVAVRASQADGCSKGGDKAKRNPPKQ
jgi:hypothetical protein